MTETEGLKWILQKGRLHLYRNGGKRVEEEVKKTAYRRRGKMKKEEKVVIYKIKYKECEKVCTGKTKFNLDIRLKQHMKDIQYTWINNAVVKQN